MKKIREISKRPAIIYSLLILGLLLLVLVSNLYLQWCQNNLSTDLMLKFAFDWHVEKFFLGCLVLVVFLVFLISFAGSYWSGMLLYSGFILLLGFADYQKMTYRKEPIYPDDLKILFEFGLLKDILGILPFLFCFLLISFILGFVAYTLYKSFFLSKNRQFVRMSFFFISLFLLIYFSHFNQPSNLLRKAYNKTALWIPYSQKMNYYNTGFIGGFLYNLKVEPMEKPKNYSEEKIKEITDKYTSEAQKYNQSVIEEENPNIIFIMSESFSDPMKLEGIQLNADPIEAFRTLSNANYSGTMLSQNYGGGTANIEFEALTGFSMEPLNSQMTTPYTMLLPKMNSIPSIVSLLQEKKYETTAIHPYNTSMYKRQDVYKMMGFGQFLDEDTMENKNKIEENPYISDQSAFAEISSILTENTRKPQFVHLVTMQTHMPYNDKYSELDFTVSKVEDQTSIESYLQDIHYTSEALDQFLTELDSLSRRTLVVFWGDHLPGIYGEQLLSQNLETTLHETPFLFYDNRHQIPSEDQSNILSPIYFGSDLFRKGQLPLTGFYQLLSKLQEALPAFEKGLYYQEEKWQETLQLTSEEKMIYEEYCLIEYDIVAGEKYSEAAKFYEE